MDAAGELFYREGLHAITADRVADHAGLTKPTIYNLFGSKDALVLETLSAAASRFAWHIEQRAAAHDDPERKLLEVLQVHAEMLTSEGFHGCPLVIAAVQAPDSTEARELAHAHKTWLRGLLAQFARRAGLKSPDALASSLVLSSKARRRCRPCSRLTWSPNTPAPPRARSSPPIRHNSRRAPDRVVDCARRVGDAALPVGRGFSFPRPSTCSIPWRWDRPKSARSFSQPAYCSLAISARYARRYGVARLALAICRDRVAAVARAGGAAAVRARTFQSRDGADDGRAARGRCWRSSRDARRAVFEGRWRAAVARRVSASGAGNVSDHHADLRRLMADGIARQPGMVLAPFRRARVCGRGDRLSPRAGMEVARADRRCANGALLDLAGRRRKFDGDPSRIVLVGRSAGAQLAMRLAYQEGPSSIRGVVNYYGPVDLADGWRHPPQPDPANVRGILEMFIGGTPDQKPEHYHHASPITWVSKAVRADAELLRRARPHRRGALRPHARRGAAKARARRRCCSSCRGRSIRSTPCPMAWAAGSRCSYTERFIAWAVNR